MASTEPFLCPTCGQEHYQTQITELKNTVEALKLDLSQLKKAFADFRDQATQPTTINSTTINSKSYAAAATTDHKTGSTKQRRTVTDVRKKSNLTHQSSKRPPDSTPSAPGTVPSNNSAASNSTAQSNRARVEGARRIWGTVKSCTVGTVRNVIQRFCMLESRLRVRCKTSKLSPDSNRIRWWFVLHGDETLLTSLESHEISNLCLVALLATGRAEERFSICR